MGGCWSRPWCGRWSSKWRSYKVSMTARGGSVAAGSGVREVAGDHDAEGLAGDADPYRGVAADLPIDVER